MSTATSVQPILEARALTRTYGRVVALDHADFALYPGEVLAVIGDNGAGKSTLIKCLSGAITPDRGEMRIGEATYAALTPRHARQAGVAVIYQELSLAATLNVYENVFLGEELRTGPFVRRGAERAEARRWLERLGAPIAPDADLGSLGNADLQLVEIAKSLRRAPKVLILDEPTASLTEREAEQLAEHLIELKKQQLPVLYVTHRLGEVFRLADRVTVLRGGRVVLTAKVADVTRDDLVTAIAGRSLSGARDVADVPHREALLEARGLVAPGIGPIDLDVRRGEIVGLFGLVGAGRTELVETLFGAHPRHAGTLTVAGRHVDGSGPTGAVRAGIALVPSDRRRKSVIAGLSAMDNMLLPSFRRIARRAVRSRQGEREAFTAVAEQLNLQPRRPDLEARRFSGGNQQKLVIGRWLCEGNDCQVLLLDEPTEGVDVGARSDLYAALKAFAQAGRGVVVTSSEPEELLALAHRVIVLSRGRSVGELQGSEISERRLLDMAHYDEPDKVA